MLTVTRSCHFFAYTEDSLTHQTYAQSLAHPLFGDQAYFSLEQILKNVPCIQQILVSVQLRAE